MTPRHLLATLRRALQLLLLSTAVFCAPVLARTEPGEKDPIADQAEDAYWWGDFERLDRLYREAQASSAINAFNGRNAVHSVRAGIVRVLMYGRVDEVYFRELDLLSASWVRQWPDSVLARLLHARVLYGRAWHVRGSGTWDTVPLPAQREFARLIDAALAVIVDSPPQVMSDASASLYLLLIGRSAGWPIERLQPVAEDGIRKRQTDEALLLNELVFSMLPRWGGSLPKIASFIDTVDAQTRERRGHELYALLYWSVANSESGNLFRNMPARWAWIKEGLESMSARYGDPRFLGMLTSLACMAEDRDTAARGIARLGEKVDFEPWAIGGADGRRNYESCLRWLRQG